VAELLKMDATAVGVKAKTPEGMGTDNAAIAHVIVLLIRKAGRRRRRAEAVEAVPQPEVDSIVEDLVESVETTKRLK
jgi:2-C-methyl-D-erythritol 2,4-cyclodiphosphate synthase